MSKLGIPLLSVSTHPSLSDYFSLSNVRTRGPFTAALDFGSQSLYLYKFGQHKHPKLARIRHDLSCPPPNREDFIHNFTYTRALPYKRSETWYVDMHDQVSRVGLVFVARVRKVFQIQVQEVEKSISC